jgi:hypothetical protein
MVKEDFITHVDLMVNIISAGLLRIENNYLPASETL